MLRTVESIYVIVAVVVTSIAFLFALNRLWPPHHRQSYNSVFAWQFNFLGTTYGVIISFMLFTAWTDFYAADLNTDAEANALVNLARVVGGLPVEQRDAVRALAQHYANVVLYDEWPAMSRSERLESSRTIIQQFWSTLTPSAALTPTQQVSLDHAFSELSSMTEHRRIRQLQTLQHMPGILWAILILGSILTISYACLFGAENLKLHALQVFGLSVLIALCLTAIADLSRPFQGGAHIEPYAFMRAKDSLQSYTPAH